MNKKKFLSKLKTELEAANYEDRENLINYYEELIDEKIENGEKEADIIKELGSIDKIMKDINIINYINKAKEKPTVSNGIKAFIITLSIFSLPLLLPLAIVGVALLIAISAVIFSVIIAFGALLFSGIILPFGLVWQMFYSGLPLASFVFGLGISFILIAISIELIKLCIKVTRELSKKFYDSLANFVRRRKGVMKSE